MKGGFLAENVRPIAVAGAAVLFLVFVGAITSPLLRARATATARASVPSAPAPVALADVVENLPASSWKAVPLTVPHDGVLEVEVGVARGNPVNVFVTTPSDMQQMRDDDVTTVRRYPGFEASMTKQALRHGQLTAGDYYLVLQDPSAATRAAFVSDVAVQASLRR